MNILTGIALAHEMGIDTKTLVKSVARIKRIEHRLELKKINGFSFIDNAFNSNPVGCKLSLDVLAKMPGRHVIVTPGLIDLGPKEDSVYVSLSLIKNANIKMLERLYYIDINKYKDSIIIDKDNYINKQSYIIKDYQTKINTLNKRNKHIEDKLYKVKNNNKIIYGTTAGVLLAVIIGIIIK